MRLYEISAALEAAIEGGYTVDEETGEIAFSPDDVERLAQMRDEKLEACGLYIKNAESEAKAIRDEEKALAERRRSLERKAERLREYVLGDLLAHGGEVDTPRVHMKPARKPASVEVLDETMLPAEFVRVKYEADKASIRRVLSEGRDVPGAKLSDETYRLSLR